MLDKFEATPNDPWYIDPTDVAAVLLYAYEHVVYSSDCTHGNGFTYDFCPFANGNILKAL